METVNSRGDALGSIENIVNLTKAIGLASILLLCYVVGGGMSHMYVVS